MQAAIQGDAVRVTGAKRDDLQAAMALIRKDIDRPAAVLRQLPGLSARMTPPAAALPVAAAGAAAPPPHGASRSRCRACSATRRLLIVDGGAPKTRGARRDHQGVKVLSTCGDQAVVEIGGKRHTLRVGDAPASVGGGAAAAARQPHRADRPAAAGTS